MERGCHWSIYLQSWKNQDPGPMTTRSQSFCVSWTWWCKWYDDDKYVFFNLFSNSHSTCSTNSADLFPGAPRSPLVSPAATGGSPPLRRAVRHDRFQQFHMVLYRLARLGGRRVGDVWMIQQSSDWLFSDHWAGGKVGKSPLVTKFRTLVSLHWQGAVTVRVVHAGCVGGNHHTIILYRTCCSCFSNHPVCN